MFCVPVFAFLLQTCDIVSALSLAIENESGGSKLARPITPSEGDSGADIDNEWIDDMQDDDDSGGEESDEDSLCSKLCTFTQTQKEFMNQHW